MADSDLMTMPPAILPDENDDARKRRLVASAGGMPPATFATANARPAEMSPGFSGAAMDAARGNANGNADGNAQDSERFGHLDENVRQAHLRRAATLAEKAIPAASRTGVPATPGNVPGTATMPPANLPAPSRSAASVMPPAGVSTATPSGAASPVRPTMPPAFVGPRPGPENVPKPDVGGQLMPPATISASAGAMPPEVYRTGDLTKPTTSLRDLSARAMPAAQVGPATQRLEDLLAKPRPELHGWKKVLDVIGQMNGIGQIVEANIPGSPQFYDAALRHARSQADIEQGTTQKQQSLESSAAQARFNTPEKRQAYMDAHPDQFEDLSDFQKNDWKLAGKFPQHEPTQPKAERPENLDREAYDFYTSQGMTPADARKRVLQDAQDVKPDRPTRSSPFEAFAYGTPEEKKSAQDFLGMEKRLGSRYRTPNEFEEKFRLFKEDPDTYKAMFGDKDKTGTLDRATATKMLNYFDRRRREINQDFTLDDTQKQEQLKDIEGLEKPFMNVVQSGASGGASDRVKVIDPSGNPGTIPRSQLPQAKNKGYKVAGQQP